MQFILKIEDEEYLGDSREILYPEHIEDAIYDEDFGEWLIQFSTTKELVYFMSNYGSVILNPPEDDYCLPELILRG